MEHNNKKNTSLRKPSLIESIIVLLSMVFFVSIG